jgi:hypothetical protein
LIFEIVAAKSGAGVEERIWIRDRHFACLFFLFSATGWKPVPSSLTAVFITTFREYAGMGHRLH